MCNKETSNELKIKSFLVQTENLTLAKLILLLRTFIFWEKNQFQNKSILQNFHLLLLLKSIQHPQNKHILSKIFYSFALIRLFKPSCHICICCIICCIFTHNCEHLLMQNYVFMVAMVELMHNYMPNYAASAANGNQALSSSLLQMYYYLRNVNISES